MASSTCEPVLAVLDGATGREHFRIGGIGTTNTPALGDIDGDGVADIVVTLSNVTDPSEPIPPGEPYYRLGAFRHDGTPLWETELATRANRQNGPTAIALADLDQDGSPEIIAGLEVHAATGTLLWTADLAPDGELAYNSPTAVDLDGDGFLEVVVGDAAYRHDGTVYYRNQEVVDAIFIRPNNVIPAVADLDADGSPEVVASTGRALFVLSSDGTTRHRVPVMPDNGWPYPPAIHAVPGGEPLILLSDGKQLRAYASDLTVRWSVPVTDVTGAVGPTAFDFLGDGTSQVIYADEQKLWILDLLDGRNLYSADRWSQTGLDHPVVADVDNDGSADILVTTSMGYRARAMPGLQMISDREGRWAPAPRIFNQDTYHVTNVNEDGTIPRQESPHYRHDNSFRTQAVRLEVCGQPPE
jgi:hypothetical protein